MRSRMLSSFQMKNIGHFGVLARIGSVAYLLLVLEGCSGLSFAEFQDAEALIPPKKSVTASIAYQGLDLPSLYYDSTRTLYLSKSLILFVPPLEVRYRFSVAPGQDAGITLWTLHWFKIMDSRHPMSDIGVKLNWKNEITQRTSQQKVSVGITAFTYYSKAPVDLGPTAELHAWGVSPTITYSYLVQENPRMEKPHSFWLLPNPLSLRSVYAGLKLNVINHSISYFEQDSATPFKALSATDIVYMPFVGYSSGNTTRLFTEFQLAGMKNPHTQKFETTYFLNFGITWLFSLEPEP